MYVPDPFVLEDPAAAALRVTGDPQAQEIAALMESPAFDR